jgi:hypothetical protein
MARRTAGWWGLGFVVLLLLSAGMVTVPGRGATVQAARGFYRDHLGIIVVAQVMGLMAAAAFVLFAVGLQRQDRGRPLLRYAGVAVAAASVVTAVPVLWLCMPASTVTPAMLTGLLVASDIADVVLFLAIAIAARGQWTKALALAVALLSIVRAVLLVTGSGLLEVAAPVAFLVLVLVVSVATLTGRPLLGDRQREA